MIENFHQFIKDDNPKMTQLEKLLLIVIGTLLIGWMGWISLAVAELSSKQREDSAQWKAIGDLREFHLKKKE